MRIGLSFGTVLVGYIDGNGYREWTLFGETVHLAKRLHALKGLKTQYGLHGAFGILTSERDAPSSFRNSLGLMAGTASRMTHEVVDGTVEDLKGVSPAYCAHLFPKNPSS